MKLSDDTFLMVVDATPLVAIDLVIRDSTGHILMGKRTNQPALGTWFVPGGRIYKGETVDAAIARIGLAELGVNLARATGRLLGVFDHFYETNYANARGVQTHYVVLAYEYHLDLRFQELPLDQHSDWEWVCECETDGVHEYAAAYFKAIQSVDNPSQREGGA